MNTDNKVSNIEDSKTTIINSELGKALGFTEDSSWNEIIIGIANVINYSEMIQTATTDASSNRASCYRINGDYIDLVPAIGYWGSWDWDKSCIKLPISVLTSCSWGFIVYTTSAGNGTVSAKCPSNSKFAIGIAAASTTYNNTTFACSISSDAIGWTWLSNTATDKRMVTMMNPGNTISAYSGKNTSNTRYMAAVAIIYLY